MKKISFTNIAVASVFVLPLLLTGSCSTDDVSIGGIGIQADSTEIYLDSLGTDNHFVVSSKYPWELSFKYPSDESWLTVSPTEGDRQGTVTLEATDNDYRRRNTFLILDNGYRTFTVNVIQRATRVYEPGTVILSENFGQVDTQTETAVDNYNNWGKTGTSSAGSGYSGRDAFVQVDVTSNIGSPSRPVEAYPDASMGNNLKLAPEGVFEISRITISAYTQFILTFYLASVEGGNYDPKPSGMLEVLGGTGADDVEQIVPVKVIAMSEDNGWQKMVAEFTKTEAAGHLYLSFRNTGSQPLYIDDILLESAGKGTVVIGIPAPYVITHAAEDVTSTGAKLPGSYTLPSSIASVDSVGIFYKLTDTEEIHVRVTDPGPDEKFTYELTGLTEGDQYQFRAYAAKGGTITYGDPVTFTAEDPEEEDDEE